MERLPLGGGDEWLKILAAALLIYGVFLLRRVFTGKTISFEDAFLRAFLGWFQKQVWVMLLIALAVPAFAISPIPLLILAILVGAPVRPFVQDNFYYAFVPFYVLTVGIFYLWWRDDK